MTIPPATEADLKCDLETNYRLASAGVWHTTMPEARAYIRLVAHYKQKLAATEAENAALRARAEQAEAERDQFKAWLANTQKASEQEVLDVWQRMRAAEARVAELEAALRDTIAVYECLTAGQNPATTPIVFGKKIVEAWYAALGEADTQLMAELMKAAEILMSDDDKPPAF